MTDVHHETVYFTGRVQGVGFRYTTLQIAKEFEIHPVQVSEWKKLMSEGATRVFAGSHVKKEEDDFEAERTRLHSKIGQLAVEVERQILQ